MVTPGALRVPLLVLPLLLASGEQRAPHLLLPSLGGSGTRSGGLRDEERVGSGGVWSLSSEEPAPKVSAPSLTLSLS